MFAELHCKSNFSFLRSASHPAELVQRAAELRYDALAITDRDSLAGIVRAHGAAKDVGLKLIVGAEVHPTDGPPLVLWTADRGGYANLCRLLTVGRRRAPKGECRITAEDLSRHAEGLLAGVPAGGGPAAGGGNDGTDEREADREGLGRYREMFGDRCYLLGHLHLGPDDGRRLETLRRLSRVARLPLVAAGDVRYHVPARLPLFDLLTAVRHGRAVAEVEGRLLPNAQRHLREVEQIRRLWSAAPEAVRRTREVADRCRFSLDELRYEYPEELAPPGMTPLEHLERLARSGARRRYPAGVPERVSRLLSHELRLIEEMRYEAYFLTVWDLVRFARSRGILCQGRGSAANSAVCFCLGVTSVDPATTDVLFERFVSRERNEAPDIDVDFEHERREEVLQYVYEKYGRERAGITAEVITYRSRSAIRDVGKALGLSPDRVDALAKNADGYRDQPGLDLRCREVGIDPDSVIGRRLLHLVRELIGFPRHLSQHVGGMVITRGPLCELVPIENAAMEGRTVIQWNKDDLDELGILKVDCLSLGMLTAIRKCFQLVKRHDRRELTLADIPPGDMDVYDMICRAHTIGVFQIESRAQMSMLPRLRPRCYYDLVIEVAIVRPGPIQGQMVHPYLRRRAGEEQPVYPNRQIRDVLDKTLGVPLFQEQAMRLAVVAAGFTPGEADQLRRAMGAWRRPGVIDRFRRKLLEGMRGQGLSREFAEQVFQQIRGFGEYGFPESHAASFALLVYVSAWLKYHYQAAFTAALINSQPMGFYAPAQLVADARDRGVPILPVDVNHSDWDCTLEPVRSPADTTSSAATSPENSDTDVSEIPREARAAGTSDGSGGGARGSWAVRLGFRLVSGLPQAAGTSIMEARGERPFSRLDDFTGRTGLSQAVIERLSEADVFGSLRLDRRQALWQSLWRTPPSSEMPLFEHQASSERRRGEDEGEDVVNRPVADHPVADPPDLPAMELEQQVRADYRTTGLSLRAHPLSFYREQLQQLGATPFRELSRVPNNRRVTVGGIVLLRQRPSTARGITFVTLEDETGTANLVVRQRVWDRFRQVARHSAAWLAHGKLECKKTVIHVVVDRLEDLSERIGRVNVRSRDFR